MKIIVYSLLCIVIVADPIGTHTEVNPSQLESKILNGNPPENIKEQLFQASLQVNWTHVCGAGMFKLGYLISTGVCINKIEKDWVTADVVMGDVDLNKGMRLIILDYLFHPSYKNNMLYRLNYNVGVIKVGVPDHLRRLSITFPLLADETYHFKRVGKASALCGWGAKTVYEKFSNSLNCMIVELQTYGHCNFVNEGIDYDRKHHCGYGKLGQKISKEDYGSPLTMIYENNGQETLHIIAVATGEFEFNRRYYARFIKLLSISEDVHDLVKKLENEDSECLTNTPFEHRTMIRSSSAEIGNRFVSSNEDSLPNVSHKRGSSSDSVSNSVRTSGSGSGRGRGRGNGNNLPDEHIDKYRKL